MSARRTPPRPQGPRCRTCGIVLAPGEKDFCAPHAAARIDNTGTVEELRRRDEGT